MNITVAGSGGWGLAMAKLLAEKGHAVSVWSHRPETTRLLREKRCNPKLLSGVTLPEPIDFTDRLDGAGESPIVVLATPSYAVAETAEKLRPFLRPGQTMVLLSKGFDLDHGCCLLSDTVSRVRRSAAVSPRPLWPPVPGRPAPSWCRRPAAIPISGSIPRRIW